jgi:hypothetical protein
MGNTPYYQKGKIIGELFFKYSPDKIRREYEMSSKKELTEREKIEKIATLFDEIKKVLPKSSIGLEVHDLNLLELDENIWEVKAVIGKEKNVYLVATRIGKGVFDINLYSNDVVNLKNSINND